MTNIPFQKSGLVLQPYFYWVSKIAGPNEPLIIVIRIKIKKNLKKREETKCIISKNATTSIFFSF